MLTFKKLESLGGIGSILTGLVCVAIGWMDYSTGQSWHIWAIMFGVLVVNGLLMLLSSAHRHASPLGTHRTDEIAGIRNHV